MRRLCRYRPSPAMIVALLALFVAMGGTGYAVTTLPKRSVGPAQLRKGAVRAQHIRSGAITKAKLAKSTLRLLDSPASPPALAGASSSDSPIPGGTTPSATSPDHVAFADRAALAERAILADKATVANTAAAADAAAVADRAKLAENASRLGGKSVVEFLTADTIRWIEPFSIGEGRKEMLRVGPFKLTARCQLDETIGGVEHQDLADILISTSQARSAFDGEDLAGRFDEHTDEEKTQFVNTEVAPHGSAKFEASSDGLAIGGDGILYIRGSYLFAAMNINGEPDRCKFGGYVFL